MASLLLKNVAKSDGPVDVLRNINLDIKTGELIVFVILGGVGRLCGPVIGAALYVLLETQLGHVTDYWQLPLGIILLLVVLFAQGGVVGLIAGRKSHA